MKPEMHYRNKIRERLKINLSYNIYIPPTKKLDYTLSEGCVGSWLIWINKHNKLWRIQNVNNYYFFKSGTIAWYRFDKNLSSYAFQKKINSFPFIFIKFGSFHPQVENREPNKKAKVLHTYVNVSSVTALNSLTWRSIKWEACSWRGLSNKKWKLN